MDIGNGVVDTTVGDVIIGAGNHTRPTNPPNPPSLLLSYIDRDHVPDVPFLSFSLTHTHPHRRAAL
eukprot:10315072-Prorocentrum_lima.AAC.1